MISKVAEDIVWQKGRCDCPVMFPSLIAQKNKSWLFKKASRPRFTGLPHSHKVYMVERQKNKF